MTKHHEPTDNLRHNGRALENQEARAQAANEVIALEGLSIQHFRTVTLPPACLHGYEPAVHPRGGMTVAYRQLKDNSFVEIATTICSSAADFNRKIGKTLAVENFKAGHVISVPNVFDTAEELVHYLFGNLTLKEAVVTISAD